MNEILPFNFQSQKIRTVLINNEPWFVAKDISVVLDIKNNRQFLVDLDEDERSVFKIGTAGGVQKMVFVSGSGVLKIIARSRKMSGAKKELLIKALGLKTNTIVLKSNKEVEFGEMLIDTLSTFKPDLQVITQYVASDYQLDFYIPKANLVIEFDETDHKHRKQQDIVRENKLKAVLGCKFIRVNERDNLSKAIGIILKEIIQNT
jgi:very-short-patch-repair endonuclease